MAAQASYQDEQRAAARTVTLENVDAASSLVIPSASVNNAPPQDLVVPGVSTELQLEKPTSVSQPGGPQLTTPVADVILHEMRSWYAQRCEDENVSGIWKLLHSVLFKKVTVPNPSDIWRNEGDTEDGVQMIVSKEYVARQVKQVIERREQWLQENDLPKHTLMNNDQKDAFLAELKA